MLQALRAHQDGDTLVFRNPAEAGDLLRKAAADACDPSDDDDDDDDDDDEDEDEDEWESDFEEDYGPAPPPFEEESSPLDFNDLPPESPSHDDSDDKDYRLPPGVRIPIHSRKRPRGTRDTQAPDRFNPDRYAAPTEALPRGVTGHRPDHSGEAELSDSDGPRSPFRELPKLRRSNAKKVEVGRTLHQLLFRHPPHGGSLHPRERYDYIDAQATARKLGLISNNAALPTGTVVSVNLHKIVPMLLNFKPRHDDVRAKQLRSRQGPTAPPWIFATKHRMYCLDGVHRISMALANNDKKLRVHLISH
jgi:hypothetical protein